jgi:hypothetical protein
MKYLVIIALLLFTYPALYYISDETIEIIVSEKERITTGSGESISSKFLVYSNDEVFENTDSWLYLKFASSDLQNSLKKDSTYTVKVAGWRIPLFSSYRNIISIK